MPSSQSDKAPPRQNLLDAAVQHALAAGIGDLRAEPVDAGLGLDERSDPRRAPPTLRREPDRLLHDPFAVAVTGRARIDADAVVLRHRRERRLDPVGARDDHRGHPIDPPPLRRATQTLEDLVDADDQMGLIGRLGEPAPEPTRVRQRPDQHIGLVAPRRVGQLEPVPLDLLPSGVLDVHMGPAVRRLAGFAVRAQLPVPKLAGERLIRPVEPERGDFIEQRRRPHVRVIGEPLAHVGLEPIEWVLTSTLPHPGSRSPDRYDRTVLRSRPT